MRLIILITLLGSHLCILAQSPFEQVHRTVLRKINLPGDDASLKLITDGESLVVFSFEDFEEKNSFSITKYSKALKTISTRDIIVDDPKQIEKFASYRVKDVEITGDSIYVLLADQLFLYTSNENYTKTIDLPCDLSDLNRLGNTIILYQNELSTNTKLDDLGKVYSLNSDSGINLLYQFTIEQRFLMHFQNRNYFNTYMNGVVFLAPSSRYIEFLNLDSMKVSRFEIHDLDIWNETNEKKVKQYNRLADKDPHALFTLANRDLESSISYNVRIDQVDNQRFLVTYLPGQNRAEKSFDWRQVIITLVSESSGVSRSIEYRHQSSRAYVNDHDANTKQFNFFDHTKDTFCYLDSKRYQLVIEPHAEWYNSDLKRIKSEQEESLINDEFDLCIYHSKL